MKTPVLLAIVLAAPWPAMAQFQISSYSRSGDFAVSNAFTNGVCIMQRANQVEGPYRAAKNLFTNAKFYK